MHDEPAHRQHGLDWIDVLWPMNLADHGLRLVRLEFFNDFEFATLSVDLDKVRFRQVGCRDAIDVIAARAVEWAGEFVKAGGHAVIADLENVLAIEPAHRSLPERGRLQIRAVRSVGVGVALVRLVGVDCRIRPAFGATQRVGAHVRADVENDGGRCRQIDVVICHLALEPVRDRFYVGHAPIKNPAPPRWQDRVKPTNPEIRTRL